MFSQVYAWSQNHLVIPTVVGVGKSSKMSQTFKESLSLFDWLFILALPSSHQLSAYFYVLGILKSMEHENKSVRNDYQSECHQNTKATATRNKGH